MDDMNKFNLEQMSKNITNIKNQINTLNVSTSTNTTDISDLKQSVESIKKRGLDASDTNHNNCSIKISMNQMLNNVEFNNIYSLLKEGNKNSPIEFTDEMKKKCGELVDNKIQTELEKIKLDNQKMWDNAVELIQKVNKPGEIQEIINNVPPTIFPINESAKRLMDVDYYSGKNSNPKVPELESKLKIMESEVTDIDNINTQVNNNIFTLNDEEDNKEKDKEKEKNKEKDKKNDDDTIQVLSSSKGQDSQNDNKLFGKEVENNNEKNSKNSKKSKSSKNSKGSEISKRSKNSGSKGSQNSKGSKNSGSKDSQNSKGSKNSKKDNSNQKESKNTNEEKKNNEEADGDDEEAEESDEEEEEQDN